MYAGLWVASLLCTPRARRRRTLVVVRMFFLVELLQDQVKLTTAESVALEQAQVMSKTMLPI